MGCEISGLTDVLENGMENRKNKNGRTLVRTIDLNLSVLISSDGQKLVQSLVGV